MDFTVLYLHYFYLFKNQNNDNNNNNNNEYNKKNIYKIKDIVISEIMERSSHTNY